MPHAGPLRYWSLTLLGVVVLLLSAAALVWGTVNLIGTESCGTRTTHECSSETGLHIVAVVLAPFAMGFGGVLLAFRGGGTMRRWRRENRVADMVARGEMAAPTVARPSMPAPALPDGPPATWQPAAPARTPVEPSPVDRLQQLDRMKAKGLISAPDYESQKKRILGGT